jgi:hypothetical protein
MRSVRLMALMVAMGVAALPTAHVFGADQEAQRPFGGPAPGRSVEERPFGGPPPSNRNPKKMGKRCQTAERVCELDKRKVLDDECTCPGDKAMGKVVK